MLKKILVILAMLYAAASFAAVDVLPDPAKASTLSGALQDELEYYKWVSGVWPLIRDMDSARRTFPQNGTYNVDITIYGDSYDDGANRQVNLKSFRPYRPILRSNSAAQTGNESHQATRKRERR